MFRPRFGFGSLLLVSSLMGCSGGSGEGQDDAGGSGGRHSGPAVVLGDQRSGEGTYYDADGTGACMLDASPEALDVAALNAVDWAGSASCGACAEVTGPSGAVRVRIVDLCPECVSGDLDLSLQAFEKIAPRELGRVPIDWRLVSCEVRGNLRYRYKDGSNEWWTAVQILDHRVPIESVEWSKDGQTFHAMQRTDYNYFLEDEGFGAGGVTLRVTAVTGSVVTDELPPVQELLVVRGSAQLE